MALVNKKFQELITFSRASSGTYVNSSGYITNNDTVTNYVGRSNEPENALWTKSNSFVQTNLLLQSENFTVSPWGATVSGTSTRTNQTTALGFMTGLITATSANGGLRQSIFSLASGQVYTLSFYIQSSSTAIGFQLENGLAAYGSTCSVTLNPTNGTSSSVLGFTSVTSQPFATGYIYTFVFPAAGGSLIANLEWRIPNNGESFVYGRPQFVAGAVPGDYRATYATALPILYTSPIGTLTAMKLCEDAANTQHLVSEIYSGGVAGATYTFSAYLAKDTRTKALVAVTDNATGDGRVVVDLVAGTLGTPTVSGNWSNVSATISAPINGFYRVTLTLTKASGGNTSVVGLVMLYTTTNSYAGDGTSGIYIWGAQLVGGTTAQNYQRITTATDYDTVGFPLYLFCDGSNDTMQSNTITFSTKYMTCVTGDSRTNNAAQRILLELSANSSTNDGSFGVFSPFATNGSYGWQRDNTVTSDNITTAGYTTLTPYVGTGIIDFTANPEASFTVDTSYNVSALDTGASNFGNYPIYIGARAGTSLFFSGNIYQIVFVNKLLSAAELVNLQYFVATKCGVAIPGTVPSTGAFYQTGPTLDLVFAGVSTDGIPGSGDSLMLDFTSPTYQVGAQYMVWEQ